MSSVAAQSTVDQRRPCILCDRPTAGVTCLKCWGNRPDLAETTAKNPRPWLPTPLPEPEPEWEPEEPPPPVQPSRFVEWVADLCASLAAALSGVADVAYGLARAAGAAACSLRGSS